MTMIDVFRDIIIANELGGDESVALRFSDPDGVKSGKSGWSFGVCQFDLANNGMAALCLRDCNFSSTEIDALKNQNCGDMAAANKRLAAHAEVIALWDQKQLAGCLNRVAEMARVGGWTYQDDKALLMAADYHNQFYISKGGQFFTWARGLGHAVTCYDIYKFKLGQAWGLKRPDDVKRRYANLLTCCSNRGM